MNPFVHLIITRERDLRDQLLKHSENPGLSRAPRPAPCCQKNIQSHPAAVELNKQACECQ